jgi:predicted site-specific integrase-resolvase
MDAANSPPTYLSDVQVSSRLGVPMTQLRRWAKAGRIPCLILPDGSILFDPSEFAAWLDSLRRGQPACGGQEAARGR